MISIVMAVYNGEKYIVEQMESIRMQTRQPDEVILADDCSTDSTVEVIQAYIKQHGLNWRLQTGTQNRGYIGNFTEALCQVNGDIIFLADQDDIWNRDKLERMEAMMKHNPGILALNTGFECIDSESKRIAARNPVFTSNHGLMICKHVGKGKVVNITPSYNICYNISMGCTMAFRKELLKDFFEVKKLCKLPHDWKINLLAALKGGLYFWNVPMIQYRIHSRNTTGIKVDYDLTVEYRIGEYTKYLDYYHEFGKMIEILQPQRKRLIKRSAVLRAFYDKRISILRERNIWGTIGLAIGYMPHLGIKSLPVMMDIFSMSKK